MLEQELGYCAYALNNPKAVKTYTKLKDKHFTLKSAKLIWGELLRVIPALGYEAPTQAELRQIIKSKLVPPNFVQIEVDQIMADLEKVMSMEVSGITGKQLHDQYLAKEQEDLAKRIGKLSQSELVKELPKLKKQLEALGQEHTDKEEVAFSLFSESGIERSVKSICEMQDGTSVVATGWPLFDELLAGGLRRGEVTVFLAPTNVGKTLILMNLAVNIYNQGHRIVYFVLDNTLPEIAERLHATALQMEIPDKTKYDPKDSETYTKSVYESLQGKPNDRFLLKVWPPGRKKASDVKFAIEQIREHYYEVDKANGVPEEHCGDIGAILIDYAALLAPETASDAKHLALAGTVEELVSVSRELDITLVTAAQTSKIGAQSEHLSLGAGANSWDQFMPVANVVGVCQTPLEKLMNEFRWEMLKMRRCGAVGFYIEMVIKPRLQLVLQKEGVFQAKPIHKEYKPRTEEEIMTELNIKAERAAAQALHVMTPGKAISMGVDKEATRLRNAIIQELLEEQREELAAVQRETGLDV